MNPWIPAAIAAAAAAAAVPHRGRAASFDFFGDDDWTAGAPTPSRPSPQEEALHALAQAARDVLPSNAPAHAALIAAREVLKPAGLQRLLAAAPDQRGVSVFQPQFAWYAWAGDQRTEATAQRWGRGLQRQLIGKRSIPAHVPMLHGKPLFVGYARNGHGYVTTV